MEGVKIVVEKERLAALKIAVFLVRFIGAIEFAIANSMFENSLARNWTRHQLVAAVFLAVVLLAGLDDVKCCRSETLGLDRQIGFAIGDCWEVVVFGIAGEVPGTVVHHGVELVLIVGVQPGFFDKQLEILGLSISDSVPMNLHIFIPIWSILLMISPKRMKYLMQRHSPRVASIIQRQPLASCFCFLSAKKAPAAATVDNVDLVIESLRCETRNRVDLNAIVEFFIYPSKMPDYSIFIRARN